MYKEIIEKLCCPVCGQQFSLNAVKWEGEEILEGNLECSGGHRFRIAEGVIDFQSQEQQDMNSWSECYKETDYEELDRQIEARMSETQRKKGELAISAILKEVRSREPGTVLDIACGRGMLLRKMIPELKQGTELIAADLSFDVLKYDRLKYGKLNPDVHVTYIACDATNLPLKAGTVDMAVSFYGIANMYTAAGAGVKDACRVLKADGELLDTFTAIEEESQAFSILKQYCGENSMEGAECIVLEQEIEKLHAEAFSQVKKQLIFEGIGDVKPEESVDLIPYWQEKYRDILFLSSK